jgi:hypothetical protein
VQVGDALTGIDHRQRRPLRIHGLQVGFDGGTLVGWQLLNLGVDVADAVVGIDAQLVEGRRVLIEDVLVIRSHGVPEHDRVGHLHHRGLEVQREQHALGLCVLDLLREELGDRATAHHRRSDDVALGDGDAVLEDCRLARSVDELDAKLARR